jgi:hypothetical protein
MRDRDWELERREYNGPTYELNELDRYRHAGEPRHPHGVPQDLPPARIQFVPAEIRIWPTSQEIPHGISQGRAAAFADSVAALGVGSILSKHHDRRGDERPTRVGGWQPDAFDDPERFSGYDWLSQ